MLTSLGCFSGTYEVIYYTRYQPESINNNIALISFSVVKKWARKMWKVDGPVVLRSIDVYQ